MQGNSQFWGVEDEMPWCNMLLGQSVYEGRQTIISKTSWKCRQRISNKFRKNWFGDICCGLKKKESNFEKIFPDMMLEDKFLVGAACG